MNAGDHPSLSVDEYPWTDGPRCRECDGVGNVVTASGLAFIVRCAECGRQTGMERCEVDARDVWRKVNE